MPFDCRSNFDCTSTAGTSCMLSWKMLGLDHGKNGSIATRLSFFPGDQVDLDSASTERISFMCSSGPVDVLSQH